MKLRQIVSWMMTLVLLIGLCSVFAATPSDCYVSTAVGKVLNQAPTIDGTVSEAEWGTPVIVTSPADASQRWYNGYQTGEASYKNEEQHARVWLTNDANYIYIAGTLDKESKGAKWTDSDNWNYPMMRVMLGAQGNTTDLKQGENNFEQRTVITLSFNADGSKKYLAFRAATQREKLTLNEDDFSHRFDEKTGTYHYELRIPYSYTNIDVNATNKIATAVLIGASNHKTGTTNNQYRIGGAQGSYGVSSDSASQASMYQVTYKNVSYHLCHKMMLNADFDCYVKNTANKMTDKAPRIDGVVTVDEWGEPIMVTSPTHAKATWTSGFWQYETPDSDQRAKIWLTNDENYIYVAATLDHETEGVAWTDSTKAYLYPQLRLMLGARGEATDLKQSTFNNTENFEQRTFWYMNFDQNGTPTAKVYVRGFESSNTSMLTEDWKHNYDAETNTYTYELRIPYSLTNIDLSQSNEISMAVQLGASNHQTHDSKENNRYNIGGLSVANEALSSAKAALYEDKCLAVKLNPEYDCYVKDMVNEMPDVAPSIDGSVTVDEWGEPIIVTSPSDAAKRWDGGYWKNEVVDFTQRAKVWLTNDKGYIYVAATLDKESLGEAWYSDGANWAYPMMRLMLAARGETTDLVQVDYNGTKYEQRTIFTFYFDSEGKPSCQVAGRQYGVPGVLDSSNWSVNFNEETGMYTYEVRIPYVMTNIDPTVSSKIAMGVQIGSSNYGTHAKKENNRYNIGGTGAAMDNAKAATPYQDKCLLMTLNEINMEGYMKSNVAPYSGSVAIDGKISEAEWGEPIIATYPTHCKTNGGAFWTIHKASLELCQQVKIYSTNDEENLYFAATIDRTDFDTSDKPNYARAHFCFTIGRYDEQTDMERIISREKTYERFTFYMLSFNNKGEPELIVRGRAFDRIDASACDYVIAYDATTRTYTYEIRVPINTTTLSYGNNNEMTASFTVSPAYVGNDEANRYLIGGKGAAYGNANANNFAHTGQSIRLVLNENNYSKTRDEFDVGDISLRYISQRVSNPQNGDLAIEWLLVWMGFALCGVAVIVRIRKQTEER